MKSYIDEIRRLQELLSMACAHGLRMSNLYILDESEHKGYIEFWEDIILRSGIPLETD